MHLHPFLLFLLILFMNKGLLNSCVLKRFLGVYKGTLAFEVARQQTYIASPSWDWGASPRGKCVLQN